MKFVNVSGLLTDFDRIMKLIFSNTKIHIENANDVFGDVSGLKRFSGENIYAGIYTKINDIYTTIGQKPTFDPSLVRDVDVTAEEKKLDDIINVLKENSLEIERQKLTLAEDTEIAEELEYFHDYTVDIYKFFHLEFIKFRFGVLPTYNYEKLKSFLSDINALVIPLKESEQETYIMYFSDKEAAPEVDDTMRKLMFRKIKIADRVTGTSAVAREKIKAEIAELNQKIEALEKSSSEYKEKMSAELKETYCSIIYNYNVYSVRQNVAKADKTFHLAGFMPESEAKKLTELMKDEITTVVEISNPEKTHLTPPTMLKNNKLVKPFESLVELFSLPAYNEIDPTPIVAIIFSLLFGIMFADVGQGLVLAIGGLWLYKKKGIALCGVAGTVGIVSVIFGFLFGSVFGDEHLIKPLLLSPMENSNTMMTVLIAAIVLGFALLVIAMILNLINAFRKHDKEQLFSSSGGAGLIFYFSGCLIAVLSVLKGHYAASAVVTVLLLIIPLLLIYFKEPLTELCEKKKAKVTGLYFAESFFEVFESVLSYVTNTMSFVRVGAFALNHVGMMSVVYVLAGESLSASHWIVLVIGNILVMGLEGLIVSIQVLRLMFYELFSKFYTGGGKAFKPFEIKS